MILSMGLLASACGGGDEEAATSAASLAAVGPDLESALDVTAPPFQSFDAKAYYRLELGSVDGTLHAVHIDSVVSSHRPMPVLSPDYLVVGYGADSAVVSAAPLAFPRTGLTLRRANGIVSHEILQLNESIATVFLDSANEIDHIGVISPTGDTLLALQAGDLPPPATEKGRGPARSDLLGRAQQRISTEQLAFRYAHIRFLTAGDEKLLGADALLQGVLRTPAEEENDVIADGLAALAPAQLGTVQTIALVEWPVGSDADNLWAFTAGGRLTLNARRMLDPEMVPSLVHEAAHAFQGLVEATAGVGTFSLSEWPPEPRQAAQRLLQQFRLAQGLSSAWLSLHKSGLNGGHTRLHVREDDRPVPASAWEGLGAQEARTGGFATPLGSANPWEDIAEYVGTTQVPSDAVPGICPIFSGGGSLDPERAIPYAKLVFLRGLGAVSREAFDACVHGTAIAREPGIHFTDSFSFSSELKAGVLDEDGGATTYGFIGSGPSSFQLLIKVKIDSPQASALGLHRLDEVWVGNVGDPGLSTALLGNGNNLSARAGEQGLVLFTDARPELTAGAVFGLVLQNAVGIDTDAFPFGTFRIE